MLEPLEYNPPSLPQNPLTLSKENNNPPLITPNGPPIETTNEPKPRYPRPPKFDDPHEQREYLKGRLALAFRIFGKLGFEEGVVGHITLRDPVWPDHFWINPFGTAFSLITSSSLLVSPHRKKTTAQKKPLSIDANEHLARQLPRPRPLGRPEQTPQPRRLHDPPRDPRRAPKSQLRRAQPLAVRPGVLYARAETGHADAGFLLLLQRS